MSLDVPPPIVFSVQFVLESEFECKLRAHSIEVWSCVVRWSIGELDSFWRSVLRSCWHAEARAWECTATCSNAVQIHDHGPQNSVSWSLLLNDLDGMSP